MKITREQLRLWDACYTDEKIASFVPEEGLAPLEIAALDIPEEDRLWVLLREELIPARELRLLACDWAENTCRTSGWNDERLNAIAVARRFAIGEASESERAAACAAAWSAVAETDVLYLAAARSAAWSSDLSPWLARNAAAAEAEASWASARSAEAGAWKAWSAAEAEARARQLADVVRVLKQIDEAVQAGTEAKE